MGAGVGSSGRGEGEGTRSGRGEGRRGGGAYRFAPARHTVSILSSMPARWPHKERDRFRRLWSFCFWAASGDAGGGWKMWRGADWPRRPRPPSLPRAQPPPPALRASALSSRAVAGSYADLFGLLYLYPNKAQLITHLLQPITTINKPIMGFLSIRRIIWFTYVLDFNVELKKLQSVFNFVNRQYYIGSLFFKSCFQMEIATYWIQFHFN